MRLCLPLRPLGAACRRAPVLVVLVLAGCSHARSDTVARARVATLAAALTSASADQIDPLVLRPPASSPTREARAHTLAPELAEAAAHLRKTTGLELRARIHAAGPLGTSVSLEHDGQGWRVDPDSVGLMATSPRAAVEQLAVALDRLESDPALALLTRALREDIVRNARSRADGLRELAHRLPQIDAGHAGWPLDLDYGDGLFVRLRAERGQWRVDDFN